MVKKLELVPEPPTPDPVEIPAGLGEQGRRLWLRVQAEYRVDDVGGCTLLEQAARSLDTADRLAKQVAADATIESKAAFLAAKHELACRCFVVRCLKELGVTTEPKQAHGRPYKSYGPGYA
jgi:hypothetical protein